MEMTYRGLKVQYIEQGQGPLVVLFHGWGANKELFRAVIDTLAAQYRVAALTPRASAAARSRKNPGVWRTTALFPRRSSTMWRDRKMGR